MFAYATSSGDSKEQNHSETSEAREIDEKNESSLTGSEDDEDETLEVAIGNAQEQNDHGYQVVLAVPDSTSDEADSYDADESVSYDSGFSVS